MKKVRPFVLWSTGGLIYILIEILWRGYSHWTMFIIGGICFMLIGMINEVYTFDMPLILQMAISSILITSIEFISGCIINRWLGWDVWDYSDMPFNIIGQVCLPYMGLWFLLSAMGIVLDDYLRYWWFGEEKPHYKLFRKCGGNHVN